MHPISCTNTDHLVKDLVNHWIVKNTNILTTEHNFPTKFKKILLVLKLHIFRRYLLEAEVTFNKHKHVQNKNS